MKTLKDNSQEAFDQEIMALKTIMQHPTNKYVTRLLVAIHHGTNRSLMFPWAEGNLLQFWKRIDPRTHHQSADAPWTRWMAKQFVGLASVIKLVHGPAKPSLENRAPPTSSLCPQPTKYGRHGDLKPENILYFTGSEHDDDSNYRVECGPKGILKVADFGLAAFHSRNSAKVRGSRTARSRTYRAPEFDGDEVTASADLWSFGCILLEFLVWYQHGHKGVTEFSRRRAQEERATDTEYIEDKFFTRSSESHQAFVLKGTVMQVCDQIVAAYGTNQV